MAEQRLFSVFLAAWRLGGQSIWCGIIALLFFAPITTADELPPGYLFDAKEVESVYSLQRAGYPVKEIREEIELDIWETTPLSGDRSARTLKKQTIPAKPGMFLLRSERPLGWSSGFSPSSCANPRRAEARTPTKILLPNQPVHLGSTRPLPEHLRAPRKFTAEDLKLARGGLTGEPMGDVTWLPDGEHWLQVKEGKLWKIAARTGRALELFVDADKLKKSLMDAGMSLKAANENSKGTRFQFDQAFKGILIDAASGFWLGRLDGSPGVHLTFKPGELATFSPDGKWLAFVRGGNLYAVDCAIGKETPLTSDGGKNDILNGRADWIYEEEIFHRKGQAYWWSPDSKQIAFLRFDDSQVPKFALTHNAQLHSTVETINYPKPGDKNPTVKIGVVNLSNERPETKFLRLENYSPGETIISRVGWVPGKKPMPYAYLQNRTQTLLAMVRWPEISEKHEVVFHEISPAWSEDLGEPYWLKNGSFCILSERSGHKQIYMNGKDRITAGDGQVTSIVQFEEVTQTLFFTETLSGKTTSEFLMQHQYSLVPEPVSKVRGMSQRINMSAHVQGKGLPYVSTESDDGNPTKSFLRDVYLSKPSRILDSNPTYEREKFRFGKYERTKIKTRDGFEMEAAITYPPDFHELNKYPIWMLTYGGPNAPTIKDGWGGGRVFEQILAAHGIVVLRVDPQSASGKGMVNAKVCYKQLGVKELQDLEDAVDWIGNKPWADIKRVGLSGHSFGGFLTAFALTHSKKFSAGIAGAPVTDWRLYDSIYTERYMGLPSENKEGYDKTSVIKAAKDLHGELLIVHGLVDDNVHAQNSLQLISALQKAGKDFEVMVYPNDRHGIAGIHYPQTQLKFILRTMGVTRKD